MKFIFKQLSRENLRSSQIFKPNLFCKVLPQTVVNSSPGSWLNLLWIAMYKPSFVGCSISTPADVSEAVNIRQNTNMWHCIIFFSFLLLSRRWQQTRQRVITPNPALPSWLRDTWGWWLRMGTARSTWLVPKAEVWYTSETCGGYSWTCAGDGWCSSSLLPLSFTGWSLQCSGICWLRWMGTWSWTTMLHLTTTLYVSSTSPVLQLPSPSRWRHNSRLATAPCSQVGIVPVPSHCWQSRWSWGSC